MTAGEAPGQPLPHRSPVSFRSLTFLDGAGEATVGCLETGAYAVIEKSGVALLRRLQSGLSPDAAARWFQETYGEPVDIMAFIHTLADLGFVRSPGEAPPQPARVRWSRLGRAIFSPAAGVAYLALICAGAFAAMRRPELIPANHDLFFTPYLSVIMLVMLLTQAPLILLHETAHALAGRRLGLPTRLSVGYRLYYLVLETQMDGLAVIPRSRRWTPILAGMLCDLGVVAASILAAAGTMEPDGRPSLTGRIALAIAYATLLRIFWQFLFYLETDLYHLVTTIFGCVDLQAAARDVLLRQFLRLTGRPGGRVSESAWHPRDLRVARWYSWLLLAGWAFSIASLAVVVIPVGWHVISAVGTTFADPRAPVRSLLDRSVFLFLNALQVAVIIRLARRRRSQRRAAGASGPDLEGTHAQSAEAPVAHDGDLASAG